MRILLLLTTAVAVVLGQTLVNANTVIDKSLVRTDDPRCANVNCNMFKRPLQFDKNFPTDSTTCLANGECPRCIPQDDPTWKTRLEAVGAGLAERSISPTLIINNWLSSEITDTIGNILLREAMGFEVNGFPFDHPPEGDREIACCQEILIEFEGWSGDAEVVNDEEANSLKKPPIGYSGRSGLFVPGYTVERFPLATAYQAHRFLDDYAVGKIFPRGGTTNCSRLLKDSAAQCREGNYMCDDNPWELTSCVDGRYVPPQCKGNISDCSELLLVDPNWDVGFFEGLIKNTQLPMVGAYLGTDNMITTVTEKFQNREDFVFFWWEPDPLTSLVDGNAINFLPDSTECEAKRNPDPALNQADCGYPQNTLFKGARRDQLSKDPDLDLFFDSFTISGAQIRGMLSQHIDGGGNEKVFNISCGWVRDNYDIWKDWVRNTPPPSTSPSLQANNFLSSPVAFITVATAGPIVLVGLIALIVFLCCARKKGRDTSNAPKSSDLPFAVMFTDIQASTALWSRIPTVMGPALDDHHTIIRRLIKKHHAYEVKTIGDAFMVTSSNPEDLYQLARDFQETLYQHSVKGDDGGAINKVYEDLERENDGNGGASTTSDGGERRNNNGATSGHNAIDGLWCGLRVRVGLHFGMGEVKFDEVTKGFDYYGSVVNTASRIEGVGNGGQIVISQDFLDATNMKREVPLGSSTSATDFLGGFTLRGTDVPTKLYQLNCLNRRFATLNTGRDVDIDTPKALRQVAQLPHRTTTTPQAGTTKTTAAAAAIDVDVSSQISGMSSTNGDHTDIAEHFLSRNPSHHRKGIEQAVANLDILFSSCPEALRRTMINQLCHQWRVDTSAIFILSSARGHTFNSSLELEGLIWALAERVGKVGPAQMAKKKGNAFFGGQTTNPVKSHHSGGGNGGGESPLSHGLGHGVLDHIPHTISISTSHNPLAQTAVTGGAKVVVTSGGGAKRHSSSGDALRVEDF